MAFVENFFLDKTPYDLRDFVTQFEQGYAVDYVKEGELKKARFSPSTLAYGKGACPRFWYLVFQGAQQYYEVDWQSVDNMESGTDRHARWQSKLKRIFPTTDIEYELDIEDPPFKGYVDAILRDFNGYDVVVEGKTNRSEAMESRRAKNRGPDYHEMQILIYMYITGIDHGLFLYEENNTKGKLWIAIEMTEENRARVEKVFEWMREVKAASDALTLPMVPYRSNSAVCKECPIKNFCKEQPKGDIKMQTLPWSGKA